MTQQRYMNLLRVIMSNFHVDYFSFSMCRVHHCCCCFTMGTVSYLCILLRHELI